MNTMSFQVIDGGRVAGAIRKSVHSQLFDLGHGVREVARRNGMRDNQVVQLAIEEERRISDQRADLGGFAAANDLVGMAERFGPRIHFAHLRTTRREADGLSFFEADHLDGDVDMVGVVGKLLKANGGTDAKDASKSDTAEAFLQRQSAGSGPYTLTLGITGANTFLAAANTTTAASGADADERPQNPRYRKHPRRGARRNRRP